MTSGPKKCIARLVGPGVDLVGVHLHDDIRDGGQEGLLAGRHGLQGLLRLPTFGDIFQRAFVADDLSGRVAYAAHVHRYPQRAAVAVAHLHLYAARLTRRGEGLPEPGAILRPRIDLLTDIGNAPAHIFR